MASTMLIAEMPELGALIGEEAAPLAGLAPVAHESGTLRGKRATQADAVPGGMCCSKRRTSLHITTRT